MAQPNQGKPAPSAPTSTPIKGEQVKGDKGEVMFGHQPGGTRGSK